MPDFPRSTSATTTPTPAWPPPSGSGGSPPAATPCWNTAGGSSTSRPLRPRPLKAPESGALLRGGDRPLGRLGRLGSHLGGLGGHLGGLAGPGRGGRDGDAEHLGQEVA